MRPAVCVHAHFYQPPREDPISGDVPCEQSAAPHHDWNHRITAECYEPFASARILRADGDVERTVNLYERINFNVGPTLAAWLERHAPQVLAAMQAGDAASARTNRGHGGAIAQPYVHAILPLADARTRETLIRWGLAEFEHRFGRRAEGMWLPETAADTPSLEALAAQGIAFTILAPHQMRAGATERPLDSRFPVTIKLPSGRQIAVFAYDSRLAHGIAFGKLLRHGHELADALTRPVRGLGGLSHVATDGETFGHHHKFGEMALAWALDEVARDPDVELTTYAAFLTAGPPRQEGLLVEPTSWSCEHGIERWRSGCGCAAGRDAPFGHGWRTPLREAVDNVTRAITALTDDRAGEALFDPWAARHDYIRVVLDGRALEHFLAQHAVPGRNDDAASWMRAHVHLLLAQSSCGWFFDEFDGLEARLVLGRLAAATALVRGLTSIDLDGGVESTLAGVRAATGDGATIWRSATAR